MNTRSIIVAERIPVTKAAEVLGISRVHAYNLIEKGELRAERYGPKSTLVLRDSLLDYLRRRGATVELIGDELTITEARVPINRETIRDFCRRWQITSMAFFGSVLRDDFRPDSDVDVLVTFAPDARITLFTLPKVARELGEIFGRKVDLVDRRWIEHSHNPIRRTEILATAQEVYRAAA